MERERPQARQTYVTDNGKGVQKRGDGLDTGPVGAGTAFREGAVPPRPAAAPLRGPRRETK